jgi:hypothetical protein
MATQIDNVLSGAEFVALAILSPVVWLRLRCSVGQIANLRPIANRPHRFHGAGQAEEILPTCLLLFSRATVT